MFDRVDEWIDVVRKYEGEEDRPICLLWQLQKRVPGSISFNPTHLSNINNLYKII